LKKYIFNALKLVLIVHILISSGAVLYGQLSGSQIDPIKAILKFQPQNSRDDPAKDVEFTAWQKIKSTVYGAITGKICDKYSAYGSVTSDFSIVGDLRDLVTQSWKYLNNEDVDGIVFTLSAYGIVLSAVPVIPLKTIYLKGFKLNPIVILGLSKSHVVIHTLKILKKHNLVGLMIPVLGLFLLLSLFPPYVTAAIFVSSVAYLLLILFQIFKFKGESQTC
jgi:hypothetical protein